MNLNRWIVVPITSVILFGIGLGVMALIGLAWHSEPVWLRWGAPFVLVIWYLLDCLRAEQPQK
ncbi:MAG TPA: hypothetical protein VMI31_15915 [Fimbriimonadaceae bacterium]|nr:hypothetical protein [Fimbriimonadaceae bacterium]